MDEAKVVATALADRRLANAVASHKGMFFAEKAADGTPINYVAAVEGALQLVPTGEALEALAMDYDRMVSDGLLLDDAESFQVLVDRCADIAGRINRSARTSQLSEPIL